MREREYPWYDSVWLESYSRAKGILAVSHPDRLDDFVKAMDVFRTRPDFEAVKFESVFDESTVQEIKNIVKGFKSNDLEKDELLSFGRQVIHDDPRFTKLQQTVTSLVSEVVGEEVEPCYNFLSLYNNLGVCEVHMDTPWSKWTFDYCIEQSEVWPIYFSQVRPWPEDFVCQEGEGWQDLIRGDPENAFTEYRLDEGNAIVFGGSSQWHYRDRIKKTQAKNFCHLLFFHFIPKGTRALVNPSQWFEIFGVPELDGVDKMDRSGYAYSLAELIEQEG